MKNIFDALFALAKAVHKFGRPSTHRPMPFNEFVKQNKINAYLRD